MFGIRIFNDCFTAIFFQLNRVSESASEIFLNRLIFCEDVDKSMVSAFSALFVTHDVYSTSNARYVSLCFLG